MAFNPIQFPISGPTVLQPNFVRNNSDSSSSSSSSNSLFGQALQGAGRGIGQGLGGMISEWLNPDPAQELNKQQAENLKYERETKERERLAHLRKAAESAGGKGPAAEAYQAERQKLQQANPETFNEATIYSPEQYAKAEYMAGQDYMASPEFQAKTEAEKQAYQAGLIRIGTKANIYQMWNNNREPTDDQMMFAASTAQELHDLQANWFKALTGGNDTETLSALTDYGTMNELIRLKQEIAMAQYEGNHKAAAEKQDAYAAKMKAMGKVFSPRTLKVLDNAAENGFKQGLGNLTAVADLYKKRQDFLHDEERHTHEKEDVWPLQTIMNKQQILQNAQNLRIGQINEETMRQMKPLQIRNAEIAVAAAEQDLLYKPKREALEIAALESSLRYGNTDRMLKIEEAAYQVALREMQLSQADAKTISQNIALQHQMLQAIGMFEAKKTQAQKEKTVLLNTKQMTEEEFNRQQTQLQDIINASVTTYQNLASSNQKIYEQTKKPGESTEDKFRKTQQRVAEKLYEAYGEDPFATVSVKSILTGDPKQGVEIMKAPNGAFIDDVLREKAKMLIGRRPGVPFDKILQEKLSNGKTTYQEFLDSGYTKSQIEGLLQIVSSKPVR